MSEKKYQHEEAFCLMRYHCGGCAYEEVFWNSRDGVTPFVVRCPECGRDMQHVNWQSDERRLDHIPEKGQGVFIDLPDSLRPVMARQRIRSFDGTEHELVGEEREEMVQSLVEGFHEGEPFLIRWR